NDAAASLEQVSGVLRALNAQPRDSRVLLLFLNRPLTSAASVNASLGTVRSFAVDSGIQVSIVALAGTGGQGPAERLAEATPSGRLQPGDQITQPIWVQVVPADSAPIDSVEFAVDGRVTHVASEPYAILLDPEQLGDGSHQLTARITSQGRSGSFLSTSVLVPMDVFRTARTVVRSWGLIGVLVIAEAVIVTLFVRMAPARRGVLANTTDFPPSLRLNPLTGTYIAPELIEFPSRGR